MARTVTDEQIKLSIIVNDNAAQKELIDLEQATRKLTQENKELEIRKRQLIATGQKESAEYKLLSASIKANNQAIASNKIAMKELQNQIGITGLTMAQLRQKADILRLTLSNMVPGSADYKRYEADLQAVNNRLSELSGRARATKSSLASMADGFNRYQSLALSVVATLGGVYFSMQKVIDMSGQLADAEANVRKTTGLTKEEFKELNQQLGNFKTRTAKLELLELSEEAGRLGITGVDNIAAFTEQANKMKVALGDDLSTEQIREVGKLTNIYKVGEQVGKDFAGSMDALGSAINEVSASGANQAGFLVDYLKRQAGIVGITNISADANIGYAATFDELGQSAEVSATAMNKVWLDMTKNPANFAKVVGMSVKDFKQIMNKDANQAMLLFLEAINKNKGAASDLLDSLKDIEAGGTRGDAALLTLASNVDLLKERQRIASQAIQEATSLTDEYTLKNENLAATLAKVQKTMAAWFTSETIISGLDGFMTWFAKFIGATDDADGKVTKFRNTLVFTAKLITIVTAALVSNVFWQKLVVLWTARNKEGNLLYIISLKARILAENIGIIASQAYAAATMLLTGNVVGATQAFRVMTATMMSSPWGFIIAAVAAIGTAYLLFSENAKKAANAQTIMNDARVQSEISIKKELNQLDNLLKIAKDETQSKLARENAIKKLNLISPEYLGNLTLENIKTMDATKAVNLYVASLEKKYMMKALEARADEIRDKLAEKRKQDLNEEVGIWDKLMSAAKTFGTANFGADLTNKAIIKRFKSLQELQKELDLTNDQLKKFLTDNPDLILGDTTDGDGGGLPPTPDAGKTTKTEKDYTDDLKRLKEEQLRIEREAIDARLSLIIDGLEKERAIEIERHNRAIEDLTNRKATEGEIALALTKSKNTKLSKQEREFWSNQAKAWQTNNQHLNSLIQSENATHQYKMNAISVKSHEAYINELKEAFEREKQEIDLAYAQKRINKEQHEQQLLDAQVKYLEKTINELNTVIESQSINGLELSAVISPEEVENTVQLIKRLQIELAKLKNPEKETKDLDQELSFANPNVDILGFTPDQWQTVFDNLDSLQGKMALTNMVVSGMQQMWQAYATIQNNNAQRELQMHERSSATRKRMLKKQLDAGVISQEEYSRKVEELDADLDKKKAEIEYQQAKRQRTMALANIAISTAQAIMTIWRDVPKVDFGASTIILTAMAAGAGIMQAAAVMSQPLPARGYEQGLYPVLREQDKKPFSAQFGGNIKTGFYNKPTILVGEGAGSMPEMIIDKQAFRQISPETKQALISELRLIKGFERGLYGQLAQNNIAKSSSTDNNSNELIIAMMSLISENTNVLKDLRDRGVVGKFYDKDMESFRYLDKGMKDYREITNKAKR